jgi:hypothetical protein
VTAVLIALASVVLLQADLVQAAPERAASSCGVAPNSVASRSPSGLAQVGNLELIFIDAHISPPRRWPASKVLQGLKAEATVYQIAPDGTRAIVPSSVNNTGGGGDTQSERVTFILDVPIDTAERDTAIKDYVSEITRAAGASLNERERAMIATLQAGGSSPFLALFRQHRVGRYRVDCRVLDEGRQVAASSAEFEVLFKGRFFDQPGFREK